jgi:hypothetical protein
MATYIIPKGKKDSGIHFNPFIGNVIEGTAILTSSCLYDTSKMTPREASSYHKITGIADLLAFQKRSGRLVHRMDMRGNELFELATYTHNNGPYNIADPGKFICFMEPDVEFYYRIEMQNKNIKFTVNDITVNHPVSFNKPTFKTLQYPYFEAGDLAADHDMVFIINKK